ncbi:MAG: triose-phosphate isomerase [Patescibacteria group bacterium]|nr:triose-phosphate isomerase [Patescibacteria group bacterium]
MNKKLIIANWKMNPIMRNEAIKLARQSDFSNIVIAPPFLFLSDISKVLKKACLGAQDVFWENPPTGGGAYTGEISPSMLKSFRVEYVIIGHSERRCSLNESDELINKKVLACLKNGLKVILCIGEDWSKRKMGLIHAKKFVENQLLKDIAGLKENDLKVGKLIIAYEPVWAIGTGKSDNPKEIREMTSFIKDILYSKFKTRNIKVLYGGSVNSKNIKSFLSVGEIDGALVGGVSLKPNEFKKVIKFSQTR